MSLYIKYQLTKNMNLIDKNTEVNVLMEHADNVLSDFMQRLEKEFIIKQSKFGNELLSGIDAKKKMLKGIMKLKDVVCSTIGVNGMYVLYEDARTTQDGITVAKNFTLKDKVENYAITLVRDAADKTADVAGDGSSSTTAITSKLVELFVKALEEDPELNLHECFTFLEQLKLQAIDYLNANKQVITKDDKGLQLIRDIAYTSSHNNDDIADAIKSLYSKLEDWNTDVSFEFNDLDADSVEMNEGYNIGHRANAFSGNRKEFESARLFVYPDKVDKIPLNFLQYIISKRTRDNSPVVLFAKHFDKSVELEATRIKEAYGVELYLIRSDTYGESQKTQFEDLCRILNINMLTKEDMSSYGRDLEYNEGYLKSLILTNEECYFVFTEDSIPIKSEITKECEQLIKSSKDKALKEMTQNRLKRLQFSKCTYFIGGITTSETANKYYLIEDAILAVKSAIKQGVVHGGCYDYIQMTEHLKKINTKLKKSQDLVLNIFVTSMLHTFELQCANSFEDYTSRLNTIIETKRMFNFKDRQFYMLENNKIKDSYSTSINCIQNAISIAKMIMLTNHIIY